jgi:hypothetical protein
MSSRKERRTQQKQKQQQQQQKHSESSQKSRIKNQKSVTDVTEEENNFDDTLLNNDSKISPSVEADGHLSSNSLFSFI